MSNGEVPTLMRPCTDHGSTETQIQKESRNACFAVKKKVFFVPTMLFEKSCNRV